MRRLIHDNDGIYMIDEECLRKKEAFEREKEMRWQKKKTSVPAKDTSIKKNNH